VPKKAHVRGFGGAGLPSRYRDSVRAIRPGLPLFLYNYSTHQLHGIFEVTPSNSICFLVDPSGSPTNFIVTWYVLFITKRTGVWVDQQIAEGTNATYTLSVHPCCRP